MMAMILSWVVHYGYVGLFVLLVLGIVGVPFPDEVLLIFAGSLVDKGDLQLVPTVTVAWCGSVCGITFSYGLGRTLGLALLHKYGHIVHLTPDKIEQIRLWFTRWGKWGLLFGYFLPGVRHLTAYVAGPPDSRSLYLPSMPIWEPLCGVEPLLLLGTLLARNGSNFRQRSTGTSCLLQVLE